MKPARDPAPPEPARGGYAARRRPRWGTLALIVLFHLAALVGLAQAFAPDFTSAAVRSARSLVTVTITVPPEPDPEPEPSPQASEGAAGEEGDRATPREVVAPEAPLPRPSPAPRASSTGQANASGARETGSGTGAGGEGQGTGSGNAGSGSGAGSGTRPLEKIAGDINMARDYPRAGREARRGHDVVIELTVGTDGRVSACRVTDPSPDPEADAVTCRLATERFVFRPRLDASGRAAVGIYRWRQRWF
jgi:protein TonB